AVRHGKSQCRTKLWMLHGPVSSFPNNTDVGVIAEVPRRRILLTRSKALSEVLERATAIEPATLSLGSQDAEFGAVRFAASSRAAAATAYVIVSMDSARAHLLFRSRLCCETPP